MAPGSDWHLTLSPIGGAVLRGWRHPSPCSDDRQYVDGRPVQGKLRADEVDRSARQFLKTAAEMTPSLEGRQPATSRQRDAEMTPWLNGRCQLAQTQ